MRPAAGTLETLRLLLRGMRPRQWTKNGVLLVGLIFARQLADPGQVLRVVGAILVFCVLSGAVYLANDLVDVEKDRLHPVKRLRPLASGRLPANVAAIAAVALALAGLGTAVALAPAFALIALGYLVLQAVYIGVLKHAVILDVLALAGGFVLRAVAGAVVIAVPISPWLYVCTLLLALFLALSKRRQELITLTDGAGDHRPALEQYSVAMLDELLQVVTTSLLVAYMLYTFFADNVPKNHAMMLTIPFVLYGLFRYLYLVHGRGEGGSPEEVLLRDRPTTICVLLWVATAVVILYVAPAA
ncbi:MAG: decaprenyl-phosphate phosphoribosyltransferase [Chloroflexi bacterium]|nr:decaprenyl-phosphate phosphoribosyltransferase [Chloroflexota bacterium]